jgi:hypothetical protein
MTAKQIDQKTRTKMLCSHNADHRGERSVPPLLVCDLRAQLAPLNRYGLPNLGVAVAESVLALIGASRTVVGAVLTRSEAH